MSKKNTIFLGIILLVFLLGITMFAIFFFGSGKNTGFNPFVDKSIKIDPYLNNNDAYKYANDKNAFKKAIDEVKLDLCEEVVNEDSKATCRAKVADLIKIEEESIKSHLETCEKIESEKGKQHCIKSAQERIDNLK